MVEGGIGWDQGNLNWRNFINKLVLWDMTAEGNRKYTFRFWSLFLRNVEERWFHSDISFDSSLIWVIVWFLFSLTLTPLGAVVGVMRDDLPSIEEQEPPNELPSDERLLEKLGDVGAQDPPVKGVGSDRRHVVPVSHLHEVEAHEVWDQVVVQVLEQSTQHFVEHHDGLFRSLLWRVTEGWPLQQSSPVYATDM